MSEEIKKQAFIYGIRAGESDIFYIGSTIKPIEKRFYSHLQEVKNQKHCNKFFSERVCKEGLEKVAIVLIETTTEDLRFEREYFWIKFYNSQGIKLTNVVKSEGQAKHFAFKREIEARQVQDSLYKLFSFGVKYGNNPYTEVQCTPTQQMIIKVARERLKEDFKVPEILADRIGHLNYIDLVTCIKETEQEECFGITVNPEMFCGMPKRWEYA